MRWVSEPGRSTSQAETMTPLPQCRHRYHWRHTFLPFSFPQENYSTSNTLPRRKCFPHPTLSSLICKRVVQAFPPLIPKCQFHYESIVLVSAYWKLLKHFRWKSPPPSRLHKSTANITLLSAKAYSLPFFPFQKNLSKAWNGSCTLLLKSPPQLPQGERKGERIKNDVNEGHDIIDLMTGLVTFLLLTKLSHEYVAVGMRVERNYLEAGQLNDRCSWPWKISFFYSLDPQIWHWFTLIILSWKYTIHMRSMCK